MTLKEKTITGVLWSAIDNFSANSVNFVVGIILARLLIPREFGLIGMITIFIAVSQTFIDSGFGRALVRKKHCSQTDYSTVFYYNMAMGILLYVMLYFAAGPISNFFEEPLLKPMVRVLGLTLIIKSLTMIQNVTLSRRIDFKLKAKISVISSVISGLLGVGMAYTGYGVWSLVGRMIADAFLTSLLLWLWNRWKPSLVFSKASFTELFGFGSKLLLSAIINTVYGNIYLLVIGKYFSAQQLGYYTRANQFKNYPSNNIVNTMSRVTYPVLAQLQDDPVKLKSGYKQMIKTTTFITFILMTGMAAIAEPMVITLIGEQWRPSIIYLQMLCFVGMMLPLHSINLNMLQVQGRSDLFLKLEIIKKLLAVPVIFIGILYGIEVMIAGIMINSLIAYYLNSYWSGRMINYSMREQIKDILPSLLVAFFMGVIVFLFGHFLPGSFPVILGAQLFLGALIILILGEKLQLSEYLYIKDIAITKIKSFVRAGK